MNSSEFEASGFLSDRDIRMLAAIRHGIHDSVLPEVSSEMAKFVSAFTIEFLDKFLVKYTSWPGLLRRQNLRLASVVNQMAELLAESGCATPALIATANDAALRARQQADQSLSALEETQRDIDVALEKLVPHLLGDTRLRSGATLERMNKLLREQIGAIQDTERNFVATMKQHVHDHQALVAQQAGVTQEKLQAYLSTRFPERRNIEITSFYELPGGSSKSTVLIDVKDFENDGITPLVVRLDRIAGTTDTMVINEVETLRAMVKLGFPAPEIVLVEPDASKVGLAFIIVRKVDAALGGSMWAPDRQRCNADTARDIARLLAKLHALDVHQLNLRGALNSDPAIPPMRGLIDNIRGLWESCKLGPDGTLEACLCWLEQNMPPSPARPSFIHADVSFHNIMVKDHRVAALLDWELSHLGDPNEDLSYCRMCIEQLMPWNEFLAEYRRHGGGAFSEETGRYFAIWRGVRNAIYTLKGGHSFHTDANPDMRWGFYFTYYRMTLLEAADKVAEAGMKPG